MTRCHNSADMKHQSNREAASWCLASSLWITCESYSPEMQHQTELKVRYFSLFKKGCWITEDCREGPRKWFINWVQRTLFYNKGFKEFSYHNKTEKFSYGSNYFHGRRFHFLMQSTVCQEREYEEFGPSNQSGQDIFMHTTYWVKCWNN